LCKDWLHESPNVTVKQSGIEGAGWGLWAKRDLLARELCEPYYSQLKNSNSVSDAQSSIQFVHAGRGLIFDCTKTGSFARYANTLSAADRAKYPNLRFNCEIQDGSGYDWPALVNVVPVKAGEELFVSYPLQ
jgi:hypothetical protein